MNHFAKIPVLDPSKNHQKRENQRKCMDFALKNSNVIVRTLSKVYSNSWISFKIIGQHENHVRFATDFVKINENAMILHMIFTQRYS